MDFHFYELEVSEIIRETKDAVSIYFYIPDQLKEKFTYKPGQYVTVKCNIDGESERRAFSLSTNPFDDDRIAITVKELDGGFVSAYFNNELTPGSKMEVMPPLGEFTIELNEQNRKYYAMIGGGSGITPLMSILKSILYTEKESKIVLFYANSSEETIIFKDKLEYLEKKHPEQFKLVHILSKPSENWAGLRGRIDKERLKELLEEYFGGHLDETEFLLCGPYGLMQQVLLGLEEIGATYDRIYKESYIIGAHEEVEVGSEKGKLREEESEIVTRKVQITLYAEDHEFEVEPDETILTAAMREGHDPPFSCQIGACSTCRAKLVSGKVHMDEREALTDEEIEEGYILTCQSHPMTDDVKVDYDYEL